MTAVPLTVPGWQKKSRAGRAREADGEGLSADQRIDVVSEPDQMTGPGFRTGARASSCVLISGMVGRAAMPTPMTTIPATRDTTTIWRWVRRSAVRIELLFMTDSRKLFPVWSSEAAFRFKAADDFGSTLIRLSFWEQDTVPARCRTSHD